MKKEKKVTKKEETPVETIALDDVSEDIEVEEEKTDDIMEAVEESSSEEITEEGLAHESEESIAKEITKVDLTDENLKSKTIKQTGDKGWYVIHSYAGYEDQVAENLKQRIETLHMKDKIFNVLVPKEKQIEIKNGKRRTVERRIFPGYVMVEMIVTDDSWYVVRNTPNVTGFIGMGVRPTPMMPDEVDRIMKRMGVQESKYKIELDPDDLVKIVDGPLKGFEGKVTEIDEDKGKVKVTVNMFGRETPVNLDSLQVKKV